MSHFRAALWVEFLKARRSKVPWLTAFGFALVPFVGGLFMVILKDPERAQSMGLIGAKAQLTVGVADWPAYLGLLAQATAGGGALLFALVTTWVFGREFVDRTAKELLAVPTPRAATVGAKFVVIGCWAIGLLLLVFGLGLLVGWAVDIPGGSPRLLADAAGNIAVTALLTIALMTPVALVASAGRGYLPPMGWAFLTLALAQVLATMGWGSWFPWAVPMLVSIVTGPRAGQIGPHSFLVVAVVCAAGLVGTFVWWQRADQTR
jgi:ABC-2 type transport system permease protein